MTTMSKPFHFKQFTIHQDRCAMKVGTDGVLLGAWTSLDNHPNAILDIGTGTGLIALQMGQRSQAETIDAVELDSDAFEQSVENFEASPWADRLFCYHASFQEFHEEIDEQYDLIITNPPFYMEGVSSGNRSRDISRQSRSLPFEELLKGISKLLSPAGSFATIIPYIARQNFVSLAKAKGLFVNRATHLRGNANTDFKRSLLQFSRKEIPPQIDTLAIETNRHQYTTAYIELTKDFYFKM